MDQFFHDEPVQQLKFNCCANQPAQELCILYQKVVVTVDALGLFNTLRAYRSYLAKGFCFHISVDHRTNETSEMFEMDIIMAFFFY